MNTGRFTTEDGCSLAYEIAGDGIPVLWQHGLGADRKQPSEVFPAMPDMQRITLECRGHGESALGDPDRLSIAQFADDVVQLFDHLDIKKIVVGGISLGAAISLRLAATVPNRVRALILARPAWVDHTAPITMRPYLHIAKLLRRFGTEVGLRRYEQSEILAEVQSVSPDNAASLCSFFSRKGEESTIELLSAYSERRSWNLRDRDRDDCGAYGCDCQWRGIHPSDSICRATKKLNSGFVISDHYLENFR